MGRGPCKFLQSDVTRALKAAKRAGAEVAGVKIERDGTIVVVLRGRVETDTARELNERSPAANQIGEDGAARET
jgi:hypothetical protein